MPKKQEPPKDLPVQGPREFADRLSYEKNIAAGAEYYTAYLHHVGKYDNIPTLEQAKEHALLLRAQVPPVQNPRDVLIYAIKGPHQTVVLSLTAKGTWKEPK